MGMRSFRTMLVVGLGCVSGLSACSAYENDLVTAKCTLVERMSVITFMASKESFDVGVRCGQAGQYYHSIVSGAQASEYAAVDRVLLPDGSRMLEIVYCVDRRRGEVEERINALNQISAVTGLRFSLRGKSADCARDVRTMSGALTDANSKSFDRQLQ